MNKDTAPGKWDTSVGGHINPGEVTLAAAKREMKEELGINDCALKLLYSYLFRNHIESEHVSTFTSVYDGDISFNKREIDKIKFWGLEEIKSELGKGIFSSHFEKEIQIYLNLTL